MELTTFIKYLAQRVPDQQILVVCLNLNRIEEVVYYLFKEFKYKKRTIYSLILDNDTQIRLMTENEVKDGKILGLRYDLIVLTEGVELQNSDFLRYLAHKPGAAIYIEDEDRFIF